MQMSDGHACVRVTQKKRKKIETGQRLITTLRKFGNMEEKHGIGHTEKN